MTLDVDQLKTKLAAKISGSNIELEDMMLLVSAISDITQDRIVSVATPDDLPELQNLDESGYNEIASGNIFFVESINVLVISCKQKWVGLDSRVLRDDTVVSTIYSWGNGDFGQLGNTNIDKSSPVLVAGGITDWTQIDSSRYYTFALTADRILYGWGLGTSNGGLGDGTTVAKSSPVTVVGGITNWSQVSAGNGHSSAITQDGVAYAWGGNEDGQVGDGTTINKSSPVTVIGGITNWKQISSGARHTLAVTETGIGYAWGENNNFGITGYGQLGDGTTINKSSPVTVIGGITNWRQLSSGYVHSLGVTEDGIAYSWGYNFKGQLGDGTRIAKSSPVTVTGGIIDWKQVSTGPSQSIGVTESGIAYAWGSNGSGRLGDGTTIDKSSPVTVVGGITNWKEISSGATHIAGVTDNGILYAWGGNVSGQLGVNDTTSRSSPVSVVGNITTWFSVATGDDFTVGLNT